MTKKKTYGPITQDYTQLNGRPVTFKLPHPMKFATGQIDIPNQVQADIYRLIYRSFEDVPPEKQLIYDQRYHQSLLYIYQLICTPHVNLDDEVVDQEGEISAYEVHWPDLMAGFHFFRYGPSEPLSIAGDQDAGAGAAVGEPDGAVSEQGAE